MNSSRVVCCCTLFVLAVTLLVETVAAQSEPVVHTNQRRVFQSVQEAPAAVTQGNPARQRQPYGFTAPVTYGSGGNGPDAIAMADLNGDGKLMSRWPTCIPIR